LFEALRAAEVLTDPDAGRAAGRAGAGQQRLGQVLANGSDETGQDEQHGRFRGRVICRVGGSKVALLVEVVRRYANRGDLCDDVGRAVVRLTGHGSSVPAPANDDEPYEAGAAQRGRQRALAALLSPTDELALVERFTAGEAKTKLATAYGISRSSVQRVLRKHRAERKQRGSAA